MSIRRQPSVNSSSSSQATEGVGHQESENMYNDAEHYRSIFTNDSRFFDTSLHLYRSYQRLGYIDSENGKTKRSSLLKPPGSVRSHSNGKKLNRSKNRPGFSSNQSFSVPSSNNGPIKPNYSTVTHPHLPVPPTFERKANPSPSNMSGNYSESKHHEVSSIDSLDDLDIIVTRL